MTRNNESIGIVAIVIAVLCFAAVLFGFPEGTDVADRVLAGGGLAICVGALL